MRKGSRAVGAFFLGRIQLRFFERGGRGAMMALITDHNVGSQRHWVLICWPL
jgi:hypothetical protein